MMVECSNTEDEQRCAAPQFVLLELAKKEDAVVVDDTLRVRFGRMTTADARTGMHLPGCHVRNPNRNPNPNTRAS